MKLLPSAQMSDYIEWTMGRIPKILFDHQIFSWQKHGGISNTFANYAREFSKSDLRISADIGLVFTPNEHILEAFPGKFHTAPTNRLLRRLGTEVNRLQTRRLQKRADIVHTTFFDKRDLPQASPLIVTIYDMTPEILPSHFKHGNPHLAKKEYCERADKIVCISENTRKDLMRVYDIPLERTTVVHLGINQPECRSEPITDATFCGLPDLFVLFVGSRSAYKNFGVLIRAFQRISKTNTDLYLVVVGAPFSQEERQKIIDLGLASRVVHKAASHSAQRYIYKRAALFVFPSLYEGFGIPILEAFSQLCPTVLSDASCFPEIGGDAAIYFNPHDYEACEDAIGRALIDKEGNQLRAQRGLLICDKLTWKRSARKMANVYKELLEIRS